MRQPFNYFNTEAAQARELCLGAIHPPAKSILEAAAPGEAIGDFAGQQTRSAAMACVLEWIAQGDYTFDAISNGCFVMADMDEDGDISPDEDDYLNELMQSCADALISLGGAPENVTAFLDDEDDAAGATLGAYLSEKVTGTEKDDETIITDFAVGGDLVLEAMVKVVRSGRVTLKKKRIGRPKKMTSLQRAGLAKARRKAFTGAAKVQRAKSMRIRKSRGM